jgi:hypothetical protein
MTSTVKDAARGAESTPAVRTLARCGFAASGVVHAGIGIIALVVAFGGQGEADQSGALKAIAAVPAGFAILWLLALLLWMLGLWYIVEGVLARGESPAKTWGARLNSWGKAVAYIAIGVVSVVVATGGRPDSDRSAQQASSTVLSLPGGPVLLGLAGLVVAGAGVGFAVIGIGRRFEKQLTVPGGAAGTVVKILGVVGYVAKGIALAAVGVLLVVAAVKVDPQQAGGLDAGLAALIRLPYGPWILSAVGIGFLAYAAFLFARTRYAKL